ncbi:MAG TPA: tripartite tricarboxylate transporter TctB family protein [Hyphomicrobiaceae bacterium]|jgi:Na+-transporting NADH:ubiquinone oxidoreductase subunit NqrB
MGLALLASGVFFASLAALLDFGRVGLPGPGFFPFVLGIALCLLAGAILFQVWRGASGSDAIFLGHRDVVIAMAAMAGLAFVFERIGAYVALGAFTAALLLLVARTALWRAVLGVVLGMVAVWLFFGMALGVQLPAADFWDLVTAWSHFGQP